MHTAETMKHWGHHLHDGMLTMGHHIDQHFRSRHFWAGVGITLLIVVLVTALIILAKNAPLNVPTDFPYSIPYGPYH